MNLDDALADGQLFGAHPSFRDRGPWRRWLTFVRAVYGLPLTAEDRRAYLQATGPAEDAQLERSYREVAAVVGRQSGKTRIGTAIVAFEAATHAPVRDGELYALLIAQDQRSALRTAFSYVRSLFEASPLLRRLIVSETSDTLRLENGVHVAAYPCRPAAVRGLRACVAVVDELAHFIATDGRPTDAEMLRALRPTLATTAGRLIILSSPYGQAGALWELHRRHYGRESSLLVWQVDAPTMNPTLPRDYLERMQEDDPEGYRSEVLGEFRAGLTTLLDPDALDACVAPGRRELPPAAGSRYHAFVDPSGGRRDAFAVAIGHVDGDHSVIDVVRSWPPPFNPSGVVAECVDLLRQYRIARVSGDRYAGEWPRERFREHGLEYAVCDKDRSTLYLELLPRVNAGTVELPDDGVLLRELRGLERRRGSAGRDRIDHRPGAHDDRANAVAGLAYTLGRHREPDPICLPSETLNRPSYFRDADCISSLGPWRDY